MLTAWTWQRAMCVVTVVMLWSVTAWSQKAPAAPTEAEKQAARQLYDEGTQAFSDGHYKDAVDLFLRGDAIVANAPFAFNAASAYHAMGDNESALRWSREYLRRAPDSPDRDKVQTRIRGYEAHLESKGVQQVTVFSTPAGATLVLDGSPAGVTPWTGEIRPGTHIAKLRFPGYSETVKSFELLPGRSMDVKVELLSTPMDATLAGRPGSDPRPGVSTKAGDERDDQGTDVLLPLSLAGAGLGVVLVSVGLGLEVARAQGEQDVVDAPDQIEAGERYDAAENLQLGARLMVGIGAAFVVAGSVGLVLKLTSSSADNSPMARLHCRPTDCQLELTGSF